MCDNEHCEHEDAANESLVEENALNDAVEALGGAKHPNLTRLVRAAQAGARFQRGEVMRRFHERWKTNKFTGPELPKQVVLDRRLSIRNEMALLREQLAEQAELELALRAVELQEERAAGRILRDVSQQKRAKQIVRDQIREAERAFGGGWRHFSEDIRVAVVTARIMGIMCGQDESTDPARVVSFTRAMMDEVHSQMRKP